MSEQVRVGETRCNCGHMATTEEQVIDHIRAHAVGRHYRVRVEEYCSRCGKFGHTADGEVFYGSERCEVRS